MKCLVPLDTDNPVLAPPPVTPGSFRLEQPIPAGAFSIIIDLSEFGFALPPLVSYEIVKSDTSKANISAFPNQPTALQATADLSSPTPDDTYICFIQITP